MKRLKRTAFDAQAPIVKPCSIDVRSIWERSSDKQSVSSELTPMVMKILSKQKISENI